MRHGPLPTCDRRLTRNSAWGLDTGTARLLLLLTAANGMARLGRWVAGVMGLWHQGVMRASEGPADQKTELDQGSVRVCL